MMSGCGESWYGSKGNRASLNCRYFSVTFSTTRRGDGCLNSKARRNVHFVSVGGCLKIRVQRTVFVGRDGCMKKLRER